MGLDQTAGYGKEIIYDWRKHARLQEFMTKKYYEKNPTDNNFNMKKVYLNKDDILELQKLVTGDVLPFSEGGFFWGHQFQEEAMKEYKKQDLKFCTDALKWIEEGKEVWYDCWW